MATAVLEIGALGFPWQTADPFLFCVHHNDAYPLGNERLGPAASLAGRALGQDFAGKDGWNMYHGEVVPGFPQHPHRGFETVTIVRKGYIDHSDSLGATARFGAGDTQWLTAGGGIVHSEMFPLLQLDQPNPVELFQIWLNLPSQDKLVEPHFSMLWDKDIPRCSFLDDMGRETRVTVIAGRLGDAAAPLPPPRSWASRADADVAIWSLRLAPGATFVLPPTLASTVRVLYFFSGTALSVDGERLVSHAAVRVQSDVPVRLENSAEEAEILLLQGRPIAEPVVQHGPFVMNSREEITRAMSDYQRTRFGGWPWPSDGPVHAREEGRFAKHADGKIERLERA
ncbi:MAG TPA: pirin family protein [Polyangiaceae bacterium]|jgi:redox-sensitive bicupin YhaK (pirin superfamily)|nr:pirin family protein [Polyangiaceae bacterium]